MWGTALDRMVVRWREAFLRSFCRLCDRRMMNGWTPSSGWRCEGGIIVCPSQRISTARSCRVTPSCAAFTASALCHLEAAGVPVVLVTARPLHLMDAPWPHVGNHGMVIVSNSAISDDAHEGEIASLSGIHADVGLAVGDAIARALAGARFAIGCAHAIRLDPDYGEAGPLRVALRAARDGQCGSSARIAGWSGW